MPEASLFDRSPTHLRRLDNGLTAVVRVDRSAPVVAIVTHVRAGYFDEPDEWVGISHVLEHMFFKGTAHRAVGEIARETKAAGGYLNAGTIYDRTSYYTVLPAGSLDAGLDIQADALMNSTIDANELRKELLVIIQEARRKLDTPAAVAQETLFELLFDHHRMRRWRIGTEQLLAGYTRDDVVGFYRRHYTPDNVVLTVVGAVDAEHAFDHIAALYGGWTAPAAPRRDAADEPPRRGFRFREIAGDITQTYAEWGWRTTGTLHADTPALDVLAIVLGQGRACRLYREVRDTGLASGISAYNYTPTSIGVFGISAELTPERARPTLGAIAECVQRVADHGVTADELQRARNIVEARLVRRLETMEGQANVLAEWQALGDWRLAEQYHHDVLAVTAADLKRVAAEYLAADLGALLLYQPRDARPLDTDAGRLHDELYAMAVAPPDTTGDALGVTASTGSTRAAAPRRLEPHAVAGDVRIYTADNGARIVVRPRASVPLVSLAVSFRGGSLHETIAEAGLTALLARASIKGTTHRSAAQLARATEALGGAIAPSAGGDVLEWELSVPAQHFDTGLDLLAETVLEPAFPAPELERERGFILEDIEQLRDDMYRYPLRLFMQAAFGDHPYGYRLESIERAIATIDRAQIHDWHEAEVLRGEPWIFIAGDVDADRAAAAAAVRFAELRPAVRENRVLPPVWPDAPHTEAAQRDKAQTALVLGFPGPARADPDSDALQVFAHVISGLGGRLFEELRSRRSLAYSVTAYPIARWLAGSFVAYIATAPEREEEATSALLDELERATATPLAEDDVERAKRYTIGAWQIRSQTNGAHVAELVNALLLGGGLDDILDYERRVAALTPADLHAAVRRYIARDRVAMGIVRGTGGGR